MDDMGDENEEEDLEDNEVDDVRGSRRTELKEDWDGSSEAHNEQEEQERERRGDTSLESRAGSSGGASSSTSRKVASARNQRRTVRGPDYHELSKGLRGKLILEGFHPDNSDKGDNATWKKSFTSKTSRREYKDQKLFRCWYVDQSFETHPEAGVRVWEVLVKSGRRAKGTKGKGKGKNQKYPCKKVPKSKKPNDYTPAPSKMVSLAGARLAVKHTRAVKQAWNVVSVYEGWLVQRLARARACRRP
jgi:hypothetical protein